MSSLADAVQQLAKGNVPAHLYERPDSVVMRTLVMVDPGAPARKPGAWAFGPPTGGEVAPFLAVQPAPLPRAATNFCHCLMRTYPGMQMIATLQEKAPQRIESPDVRHNPNLAYTVARQKVLSSETGYTLQRQRWLHPDTLALPDEEMHRLVAKRMRVDARAAARTVADVQPTAAHAGVPTNRAGVEIVDEKSTYPRQFPKLTTHVSSAPLFLDAVQHGLRQLSGTLKRKWDQSVHDECDFVQGVEGGHYCGQEACSHPRPAVHVSAVAYKCAMENMRVARGKCLRCRMQVGYVPNVMLAAREHMGNDCWEDGLKVVLEVGYEGPASVVMRVERGPACPPTEEREAEPPAAAAAAEPVCGDEEL
jgi:hypothetical protein